MSLDVYLYTEEPVSVRSGSGIYIRDDGQTREISREEWDARYPGREPAVVEPIVEGGRSYLFEWNITHNLNRMAEEAGLYLPMWRPAEMDPERAARINAQTKVGNYHGAGGAYEIEGEASIHARDLIEPLRDGLARLQSEPERFKAFNPDNGWGSYEDLLAFAAAYLAACERWPDSKVSVSR